MALTGNLLALVLDFVALVLDFMALIRNIVAFKNIVALNRELCRNILFNSLSLKSQDHS